MGVDGDLVVIDGDFDALKEGLVHLSPDGVLGGPVHLVTVPSERESRGQRRLNVLIADVSGCKPFIDCSQP
ncbi:hypothetical protein [Mesorhizobium japonicum]|uniref:hypothetical protein n=1 Tax=Mesorhizobium japonicum TaxID=2066070 RepID=UPI003B5C1FBF